MITRYNRERKMEEERKKLEAMKKWNQKILMVNQKKIAEERRLKDLHREKLEECLRIQEEERKEKQLEEKKLKELHRQKIEQSRKAQEKVKMERDKRAQEIEKAKKELLRKKQEEAAKLRDEEKIRRDFRKKLTEDQRDQDEQKRIDEEIDRWRREENKRRSQEAKMKVPIHDQVKLECQRQRVEEVIRMSSELVLKGGECPRMREEDLLDNEVDDYIFIPTENHQVGSDEEISKENQLDLQYSRERSQQEQEEVTRREAQQARYKRYQEERHCLTLEDDLQKLRQKAYALATLIDDADSINTLDEFGSHESYERRKETNNTAQDNNTTDTRKNDHAKNDLPLCVDQYEGLTYLYNRLEEEKKKQVLSKKPKGRKMKLRKQLSLPKNCGQPYTKSLTNKPTQAALELIPFLKFDGSPCFGQGFVKNYVIKR